MKDIFHWRPARPRYAFVWDLEKVLKYLMIYLCKPTILLGLTATPRCFEKHFLNTKYLLGLENMLSLLKIWLKDGEKIGHRNQWNFVPFQLIQSFVW